MPTAPSTPTVPPLRRVLLTGAAGNLGTHLLRVVPAGCEVLALWRRTPVAWPQAQQVELADAAAVAAVVRAWQPEVVIHAAYSQHDLARDVVAATHSVALACAAHGARLVQVSTDLVLDGEHAPYGEDAPPAPIIPYGVAKATAEADVRALVPTAAIVRASLMLALDPPNSNCAWILDRVRAGEPVTLFVDEIRSPIAAPDVAAMLWEIAALPAAQAAGLWHIAGPEHLSRYALGLLLAQHAGLDPRLLRPARSADLPTRRPRDLRLLTTRADRTLAWRPRVISDWWCGPPPPATPER